MIPVSVRKPLQCEAAPGDEEGDAPWLGCLRLETDNMATVNPGNLPCSRTLSEQGLIWERSEHAFP